MGEFYYSLSSGPSDPRADIFQSPFPAQQDMREGWESASSILTFLRKTLNRCSDVDSLPHPQHPASRRQLTKSLGRRHWCKRRTGSTVTDASLTQMESTEPLALVDWQLQVVIRDETLIKKVLAPGACFFLASKGSGTQPNCMATYFSVFCLVPNCLLSVFK